MYQGFDDSWILANWKKYKRWSDMFMDYMEFHPDCHHGIKNFRTHVNCDLGLTRRYTEEQNEWLKSNYPHLGARECYRQFVETFGIEKGFQGFKTHITELGLKVTEDRRKVCIKGSREWDSLPVGTVRYRARNTEWIKTEDGWKPLHQTLVDIPKGQSVIHLDGNARNNEMDNLAVVPLKTKRLMARHQFYSKDAEITRTGIKWCELYNALKESEGMKWNLNSEI